MIYFGDKEARVSGSKGGRVSLVFNLYHINV